MDTLAKFYVEPGTEPSADAWNTLLPEILRRLPELGPVPALASVFNHPYKVSVAADDRPTNTEGRSWKLRTELGCVNDTAAAFVYRAANDPRGWQPPSSVDATKTPLVDRTMLETDDPPFLVLTTPPPAATTTTDDFQPVPDSARPAYFRTEEMWKKSLFQAYVVLTSEPKTAVSPDLPAILLSRLPTRYRITAGRKPVTPTAQAGGLQEIARLYLLRDPDAQDAFSDTILVRQFLFWDVAETYVQPANPLDGYGDAGIIGDIIDGIISEDLQDAATVQWWTT